jgi:hypothetical protein
LEREGATEPVRAELSQARRVVDWGATSERCRVDGNRSAGAAGVVSVIVVVAAFRAANLRRGGQMESRGGMWHRSSVRNLLERAKLRA